MGKGDNLQWLININAPCDVLVSGNKELLGNPVDINKIKHDSANFDQVFNFGKKSEDSPKKSPTESANNKTALTSRASL